MISNDWARAPPAAGATWPWLPVRRLLRKMSESHRVSVWMWEIQSWTLRSWQQAARGRRLRCWFVVKGAANPRLTSKLCHLAVKSRAFLADETLTSQPHWQTYQQRVAPRHNQVLLSNTHKKRWPERDQIVLWNQINQLNQKTLIKVKSSLARTNKIDQNGFSSPVFIAIFRFWAILGVMETQQQKQHNLYWLRWRQQHKENPSN